MKYQIISHGIESAQYFQGCGVAFTPFDHCVTGCGDTAREAYDDALEQIAQGEHNELATGSRKYFPNKPRGLGRGAAHKYGDDSYWYVSIRYNLPKWFKGE